MRAEPFLILGHLWGFQAEINAPESPMSLVLEGPCSSEGVREIIHGSWKGPERVSEFRCHVEAEI